jgi:FkbM family methyltransferase
MTRFRVLLFFAGLAAVLAVWVAASNPKKVLWRWQLAAMKLEGRLPMVRTIDLLSRMLPYGLRKGEPLKGVVERKGQGEDPCPVLWGIPGGAFWGRADDGIYMEILGIERLLSIYERDPVVIHNGDVVLDAGSHLGTFTQIALNRGARVVVAFEPEPVNRTCFKRTFQTEMAQGRVKLIEAALWEHPGTVRLAGASASASVVPSASGFSDSIEVPATTVDLAIQSLKLDRVDFIKADIEGSERYAVRGARETLSRYRPRMVLCIYHRRDDPQEVPKAVFESRSDYRTFATDAQAYFY